MRISGSPPHARGRQKSHQRRIPNLRITPACAGKTITPGRSGTPGRDHPRMRGEDSASGPAGRASSRDHPRMRGEDLDGLGPEWRYGGSPPHARGRRVPDIARPSFLGITPACAGKTFSARKSEPRSRDHPRMRGEDSSGGISGPWEPGSPPHARGRPTGMVHGRGEARITPACAGKTAASTSRPLRLTDHPRMRGEDSASSCRP